MSNHPGYWGGSSVFGGKVRRLSVTNFREMVERIINVPIPFPLTYKEFWDLPNDKARDSAKDGAYICACSFAFSNEGHRSDENATHTVAIILDLDEGDFVHEFDANPEVFGELLYPYNFAVWRTAKYRPDKPKLKVLVDVSPQHPQHHKRTMAFLAYRLGLPKDFKGVTESGVVSQPQYRPIQFKSSEFTSVIASRVTGTQVHLSDLPELDPDEEELFNGRTYACDPSESEDEFFGLAYLPVAGLKIEDVQEAMEAIDPDVTRPVWMEIAAALRHQFTDEEEAKASHDMFVEWSSRGTKYAGRKDVWSMWRSLRPYCKGRAPITIRSLYHHAQAYGWDNQKVATKISQTIQEWIAACQSVDDLMQEGPKRLASLPFKNDIVEESLVVTLRKRLSALGEQIDKATIRKEIGRVRRADKKAKQDARGSELPSWLRPIVYVATSDTFNNLGNGVALKPGAFDRFFAVELMPKDETPANGVPVMQPSAFALNVHKIVRVEETQYDPTQKEDEPLFLDKDSGRIVLNTYNFQSPPVADPEFSPQAERLLRKTLAPLIKEPYLVELMLDYLALQVQFPGRKIPWSFLIQSAPGVGKGTLGEIMEAVLGPVNVNIISPTQMDARFNEWAMGSVFGIFNEVHIPGERRDAVMNAIKPLISDKTISLNLKNRDGDCRAKNVTNYIAFTNYKDAAHLAAEDRRWGIIFAPMQTRAQVLALQATGHFEEVRWLITPEGASALRYFLMKRVISDSFPVNGHAPDTIYRMEVVAQSKNHLQVLIEDTIEDNTEPLISDQVIHDGRVKDLLCRAPRDAALMSRYLSLMGYERSGGKRHMLDGCRGHIWTHTERWTNGASPLEFLKQRLNDVPDLPESDEETFFE